MRVEQHVYEAISSLVSGRVYPVILPEQTLYPALVYRRISGASETTLDGVDGLIQARFQFDCWGHVFGDITVLSSALKTALTAIKAVPLMEIHQFDDDARLYRAILDYHIWFCES